MASPEVTKSNHRVVKHWKFISYSKQNLAFPVPFNPSPSRTNLNLSSRPQNVCTDNSRRLVTLTIYVFSCWLIGNSKVSWHPAFLLYGGYSGILITWITGHWQGMISKVNKQNHRISCVRRDPVPGSAWDSPKNPCTCLKALFKFLLLWQTLVLGSVPWDSWPQVQPTSEWKPFLNIQPKPPLAYQHILVWSYQNETLWERLWQIIF